MVILSETKSEDGCDWYWLVNLCFKYFVKTFFFPELHTVCWRVCKNIWDVRRLSDAGLCGKLWIFQWDIEQGTSNKNDCDQLVVDLGWRIRQWKHLHPVFNSTWCSVTGIEESKQSPVTDVHCPQRAEESWEKVCLLSSLGDDISGYVLENSYSFWGYSRWMQKEEYWTTYILLFSG